LEDVTVTQSAQVEQLNRPQHPFPTGEALLPHGGQYADNFNRHDFLFDHGLAHHPMFELKEMLALAKRIPKYRDFVYWQNGRINVNERWEVNPGKRLSLEETIEGIAHNDSLVILKHAEQDEIFGPLLQEILQRIFSFTSPAAQRDIVLGESLIFINSPRRLTAYHLDLESNFLLQVSGEKFIHVHDCTDRGVTPHQELENFCCGNQNGAIFKQSRERDAHYYRLTPGHGVHFPSTAPHWVENGDQVSVSININFDLVSIHKQLKRVYTVNRVLRRLGVEPAPPGNSALRDALKVRASFGIDWAFELLRGKNRRPVPSEAVTYPVWRPSRSTAYDAHPS
jgi:hypothetical protein